MTGLSLAHGRRIAARIGAVGVGAAILLVGAVAPAHADTALLNLTCPTAIGDQPFTAVVKGTAPATAAVGDTVAVTGYGAEVTVNENLTGLLYGFLGIRSVTGTVGVSNVVDNAGTSVPQADSTMAIPVTAVPAKGALVVPAAATGGAGPSFVTTKAGAVKFQVGAVFKADLVGTTATGGTTPISVTCSLNPGQNPTIATVAVSG